MVSYFIASCGGVTLEVLKAYIDGQRAPARDSGDPASLSRP